MKIPLRWQHRTRAKLPFPPLSQKLSRTDPNSDPAPVSEPCAGPRKGKWELRMASRVAPASDPVSGTITSSNSQVGERYGGRKREGGEDTTSPSHTWSM